MNRIFRSFLVLPALALTLSACGDDGIIDDDTIGDDTAGETGNNTSGATTNTEETGTPGTDTGTPGTDTGTAGTDTGTVDSSGTAAGSESGSGSGTSGDAAACQTCVVTNCPDEVAACTDDPQSPCGCTAGCIQGGGTNDECAAMCEATEDPEWVALQECGEANCAAECG